MLNYGKNKQANVSPLCCYPVAGYNQYSIFGGVVMERRKGLIQRIVDGERLFPILARRDEAPEAIVQSWRERGVPDEAIDMAIKMSDHWLKKMME